MKKIGTIILMMLISAICGFFIGVQAINILESENTIFTILWTLVFFALSFGIQLILHEVGHLICGLMTGYTFLSFRIGSFQIQKENDQFVLKRFTLAGTGGQCLLCPPKCNNGEYPVVLYNLGGILMNVFLVLISVLGSQFVQNAYIHAFLVMMCLSGILIALMNGIPLKMGGIANDGYNTLLLYKDKTAALSFWKQLKVNELQTKGMRLKDMYEDLFTIEGDPNNIFVSAMLVLQENRYMDLHQFEKAKEMIEYLLSGQCSVLGLYEGLLKNDLMYIHLLNKEEYAFDQETIQFRKSMKNFPSVIRTNIAIEVSKGNKDTKEYSHFERIGKNYPLEAEIVSEKELISIIENVYFNFEKNI